jgi:HlyD family secretion protein
MDDRTRLLRSLAIDRQEDAGNPPAGGQRRWPAYTLTACLIVAGGGALWFALQPGGGPPPPEEAPRPDAARALVTQTPAPQTQPAAKAQPAARPAGLIASGYVVARRKAAIASEITGKIVELLVEEGMAVRAGQVLARLDSGLAEKDLALAQARVDAAEAALAAIAAELRDVERILHRTRTLSQQNYASEADLGKAEARAAVLTAQRHQSEAQLAMAKLDVQRTAATLEKHQIRAPFAGVVIERNAQTGEMIALMAAGGFTRTGVCTIVDMDSIEFEVDVNEAFIGRVAPGADASAVLDAYPDLTIPATVTAIIPTANREKATVKVRVGLKQKDPRILPDMAVKVTFLEDAAAAVPAVPGQNQ